MQHIRIIKILACLTAITVIVHFISCSSGGGGNDSSTSTGTSESTEQYTVAPDPGLTADEDGTIATQEVVIDTTQAAGEAEGAAQVSIEPGTQAYVNGQPAQGQLSTDVSFHDGESEATFPGGTFNGIMLDGRKVDVKSYGMVAVDMEDGTGAKITEFSKDMEINMEIVDNLATQTARRGLPFPATAYAVQTSSHIPYTGNPGSLGSFNPTNPSIIPDTSNVPFVTNPNNPNPGGNSAYYIPGQGTFLNTLIVTTQVITDTKKRRDVTDPSGDDSAQEQARQVVQFETQQMMRMQYQQQEEDLASQSGQQQRRWQLKMRQRRPNTYITLAVMKEYPTEADLACCESCEGSDCDDCEFDCDEIDNDAS